MESAYLADLLRFIPDSHGNEEGTDDSERPAKRAKTTSDIQPIKLARTEHEVVVCKAQYSSIQSCISRKNVGSIINMSLRPLNSGKREDGRSLLLTISSAEIGAPAGEFSASLENVQKVFWEALKVLHMQKTRDLTSLSVSTIIDLNLFQLRGSIILKITAHVNWIDRYATKSAAAWARGLEKSLLTCCFPGLIFDTPVQNACSPKDFYDAAYVPAKSSMDTDLAGINVPGLTARLYPFQKRALQWLLRREDVQWTKSADGSSKVVAADSAAFRASLHDFVQAQDVEGDTIYINQSSCIVTREPALFEPLVQLRGGIVAEEMGLGKTVEIISLIMMHRRTREKATMIYDEGLKRQPRPTSATLIVVPSSLLAQWLSEFERHAPHLSVMRYRGWRYGRTSIELSAALGEELAAEMEQQDVVITTYSALHSEMDVVMDPPARSMRHARRYERPKSPLILLNWWRLCIDEAQMVEHWQSKAATVARTLRAVNVWAVTGTPVRGDVKRDLRGILTYLRFKPLVDDWGLWEKMVRTDKKAFRALFNRIAMRHTKSLVRSEIALPPQKRYVVTMPFSLVEEEHYQNLFGELAQICGLDTQGGPLKGDWDPKDPAVLDAMRVALDRLRQTALHPDLGVRNRQALGGRKAIRTLSEVLDALLDQTGSALRGTQRRILVAKLTRGQILARTGQEQDALSLWKEVLDTSGGMVALYQEQCDLMMKEAAEGDKGSGREDEEDDEEEQDDEGTTALASEILEARQRVRAALEFQHSALFFCGDAYYSIKSNPELVEPDSDEFQRLEKLESESYEAARICRHEIMQATRSQAQKLMDKIQRYTNRQKFTYIPGFLELPDGSNRCHKTFKRLHELYPLLDKSAEFLDDLREHVLKLLLQPLLDEEVNGVDITGDEYENSAKLQDEIAAYLQVLGAVLSDRVKLLTHQDNLLVEHEIKRSRQMAEKGTGPCPEKLLELLKERSAHLPDFADGTALRSMKEAISELRAMKTALAKELRDSAEDGHIRAQRQAENDVIEDGLFVLGQMLQEQNKAIALTEREVALFTRTHNARIEYYRQLQTVSDSVHQYKVEAEDPEALHNLKKEEAELQRDIETKERKKNYLELLKKENNGMLNSFCIICQSTFTIGVITSCGHTFCKEDMMLWMKAKANCPVCKAPLHAVKDLHEITLKPQELKVATDHEHAKAAGFHSGGGPLSPSAPKDSIIYSRFGDDKLAEINNIELDGLTFTTKINTLIRHLLWLRTSDPGAKSVIFSQYKGFLNVLARAFEEYHIGYTTYEKADCITSLREDPNTEVFLLHARARSSGLNLISASHCFLCEPLVNTALELQAIARVDRIGQQHDTTVWLYIVAGTVEESIYNLSVQRRLKMLGGLQAGHSGQDEQEKGKAKANDDAELDMTLEAANSMELTQANMSTLLRKKKGSRAVSGEWVAREYLWTCLFGARQTRAVRTKAANPSRVERLG